MTKDDLKPRTINGKTYKYTCEYFIRGRWWSLAFSVEADIFGTVDDEIVGQVIGCKVVDPMGNVVAYKEATELTAAGLKALAAAFPGEQLTLI